MRLRNSMCTGIMTSATALLVGAIQSGGGRCEAQVKTPYAVYHRVEAPRYAVEVPKGWIVGEDSPFGQRELRPPADASESTVSMSTMVVPGLGRQTWDELYTTLNYDILRYAPTGSKMKPLPYKLGETRQGIDSCSWTMDDPAGLPVQRRVILKRPDGDILALSVKLPASAGKQVRSRLEMMFDTLRTPQCCAHPPAGSGGDVQNGVGSRKTVERRVPWS